MTYQHSNYVAKGYFKMINPVPDDWVKQGYYRYAETEPSANSNQCVFVWVNQLNSVGNPDTHQPERKECYIYCVPQRAMASFSEGGNNIIFFDDGPYAGDPYAFYGKYYSKDYSKRDPGELTFSEMTETTSPLHSFGKWGVGAGIRVSEDYGGYEKKSLIQSTIPVFDDLTTLNHYLKYGEWNDYIPSKPLPDDYYKVVWIIDGIKN